MAVFSASLGRKLYPESPSHDSLLCCGTSRSWFPIHGGTPKNHPKSSQIFPNHLKPFQPSQIIPYHKCSSTFHHCSSIFLGFFLWGTPKLFRRSSREELAKVHQDILPPRILQSAFAEDRSWQWEMPLHSLFILGFIFFKVYLIICSWCSVFFFTGVLNCQFGFLESMTSAYHSKCGFLDHID